MPHSDAAPAGKVTPQDIEAERSLLGAVCATTTSFLTSSNVSPQKIFMTKSTSQSSVQ